MLLEIHALALNRHKNVAWLNWLIMLMSLGNMFMAFQIKESDN
jgi:hypothetical protein